MGIYRMYTGPDNETHIEELPLSAPPRVGGVADREGPTDPAESGRPLPGFSPSPKQEVVVRWTPSVGQYRSDVK